MKDLKKSGSFKKTLLHILPLNTISGEQCIFNGNFSSASVFPQFTEGRDRFHWWPGISLAKPDSS